MKNILQSFLLSIAALPAFGQQNDPTSMDAQRNVSTPTPEVEQKSTANSRSRFREIGLFAQTDFGGTNNDGSSVSMVGVQYNRWLNHRIGYRILAGYSQYTDFSGTDTYTVKQDTIFRQNRETKISMPVLGLGVLTQRTFYRRVVLFAGLELKGSYGKGKTDSLTYIEYGGNTSFFNPRSNGRSDVSMLLINVDASVGAKLVFSRTVLGIEVLPFQTGYQHIRDSKRDYGVVNVNVGNVSQRLFFNYRF